MTNQFAILNVLVIIYILLLLMSNLESITVVLVLAGVMRSLIFELTSALNENNDEEENTSPYCTKNALLTLLINKTSTFMCISTCMWRLSHI